MERVSMVWVLTCAGTTSLYAGTRRTSSKVRASGTGVWIIKGGVGRISYGYLSRFRRSEGKAIKKSFFDASLVWGAAINPITYRRNALCWGKAGPPAGLGTVEIDRKTAYSDGADEFVLWLRL
jgi:hypothetical protein